MAAAAEAVILQACPRGQCVLSRGPSPGPSHRCPSERLHAAPGGLPRCCGNLDENRLAFSLEFCIISGSKFEWLLAPLVFQTLQMPAMETEEWRELQRPGMEGGKHPCRPGGDRHPDLPTLRRELRSRDLTDEVLPLLGPRVAFEAPSLWAQSPSCFHLLCKYLEFLF